MQNIPNKPSSDDVRHFVDELGHLLAGLGLAITPARVFAFLIVRSQPASLDEIAEILDVSKSGISTAGRFLETMGFLRQVRQPGTKRVSYEAAANMETLITARLQVFERFLDTLQQARPLANGERARARVEEMIDFYEFFGAKTEETLVEWRERKKR